MVTDMKFELVDLDYQICYYQGKYEDTHDTQWLDKKKAALDKRQQKLDTNEQTIKDKYRELFGKELSSTSVLFNQIGKGIKKEWTQENITGVEEKNKLATNKLTAELERELGINKNAIQEYERQIQDLRNKADQARRNYEGLNPSEEDLILAREYERVAQELKEKADALKTETDELQNLKDGLTLHDLANKGADAIAYGTNALVTGNAAIGLGKDVVVTGQDSIALGRANQVAGMQSAAIGTDNTVTGNRTYVLGANVTTAARNAVVLGANSTGEDNTVSVGATGKERRIIHVADATQDNDAVNFKQLNTLAETPASFAKFNKANWQAALGDGANASGNTGLITGDTLHSAIQNIDVTTQVAGKANTDLKNITEEGKTEIRNLAKGSVKVVKGENTTVTTGTDGNATTYAVNVSTQAMKDAVADDLANKANKTDVDAALKKKADTNAGNLTPGDVTAWQGKLGTGEVAEGNTGLVTGNTVYNKIQNLQTRLTADFSLKANKDATNIDKTKWQAALGDGANAAGNTGLITGDTLHSAIQNIDVTAQVAGKANTDLKNITEEGKTEIRNLAKGSVKVADGTNTTVTTETEGEATVYKVHGSKQAMKDAVADDLANKANKTDVDAALKKKADTNASNLTPDDVTAWQAKLGTGEVAEGNTGLVTGNTVYNKINNLQTTLTADLNKKANKDATNIDKTNWQAALGDGTVTQGNTGLVTGDKVYEALQGKANAADIANKANTDMDNLTDTGKTVIRDLAKGSVKVADGTNTTVTTEIEGDATVYKVHVSKQAMQAAVAEDLANKANKADVDNALKKKADTNAGNLTTDDVTAWQTKLGNGANAAGNTGLITGDTLNKAISGVVAGNASLDGEITAANTTKGVTGDKIYRALEQKASKADVNQSLKAKADKNAGNLSADDVNAWQAKLGTGEVAKGDRNLTTGDTVYRALSGAFGEFEGRVAGGMAALDTKINQSGAMAAALAGMKPLDFDGTERTQISAAVGRYQGEHALALGVYHYFNRDFLLTGGLSWRGSDIMSNVGMTFRVGKRDERAVTRNAEVTALADEVIALREQNRKMAAQMEVLLKEVEMLKEKAVVNG